MSIMRPGSSRWPEHSHLSPNFTISQGRYRESSSPLGACRRRVDSPTAWMHTNRKGLRMQPHYVPIALALLALLSTQVNGQPRDYGSRSAYEPIAPRPLPAPGLLTAQVKDPKT